MSKYQELCQAYAVSRKAYMDYREASLTFTQSLIQALMRYLEIPEGQVTFVPVNKEPDPEAIYPLAGAMHLEDDAYWHLGVVLNLGDPSGACPPQAVLLKLLVKHREGTFGVRLGQDEEDILIRPDFPQDMTEFLEHVFTAVKDSYEEGLQQFLDHETMRKIGFGD